MQETRAQLVVVDPIMAFLDANIIGSSDQAVRRALSPLAQLAEKHQSTVLLVRHLNKSGGWRSLYRGGGSIAFVGACRSAWLIARDPQEPTRCVLAQVKNNLAPPQPSLSYVLTSPLGGLATLSWTGTCDSTADQLLTRTTQPARAGRRARARAFLQAFLEAGPRTSRQIWAEAQQHALRARTLQRVKRELEIRSVRVWAQGRRLSYWLLPGQELPSTLTPEEIPVDLEPWLAPLRERFPPTTPLDDL
jgi:hypothetical protein